LRRLQAKLAINQPGDTYEQEADRVAEAVMSEPNWGSTGMLVQRKCAQCEEKDEKLHAQRKESSAFQPDAAPSIVEHVLNSPGRPLDPSTREFMESRFDQNFSGVRVHTDAAAARSARRINSLAYTHGQDVAFASGQYQPDSPSGKRLLAHELTHVVQQSGHTMSAGPGAQWENTGAQSGKGPSASVRETASPAIQRQSNQPIKLTVSGDARRPSPPGGVAIKNGTLDWELSFVGNPGSITGTTITMGSDVRMKASFKHAGGSGSCPTITFIQTVIPTIGGMPDTGHLLFTREPTSGGREGRLMCSSGRPNPLEPQAQRPAKRESQRKKEPLWRELRQDLLLLLVMSLFALPNRFRPDSSSSAPSSLP
jgi:hypothetical protein